MVGVEDLALRIQDMYFRVEAYIRAYILQKGLRCGIVNDAELLTIRNCIF